jgi:hypothetical protein
MRTTQIWILLAILLGAIVGSLWIAFDFYKLSEQRAWLACIKEYDPASAQNTVCRSQFPRPFKQWALEYQGKTNASLLELCALPTAASYLALCALREPSDDSQAH